MILPGDILWEQYRVLNVESDRASRAWLVRVQTSTSKSTTTARPLLLQCLGRWSTDPLTGFLNHIWRSGQARTLDFIPLKLGALGQVEFRGEPGSGVGVALLACPASHSLSEHLTQPATPAFALSVLAALTESLSTDLLKLFTKSERNDAFHCALAKLLNSVSLGFHDEGGEPVLGFCVPPPLPADDVCAEGIPFELLTPPGWAAFSAPEVTRGASCGEAALVYGIGQLGRALLLGKENSASGASGPWTYFALDVLGKRDASKEFLSANAAKSIPAELTAVIAKCLKTKPASRFSTLAKLSAALKKLKTLDWANEQVPQVATTALATVRKKNDPPRLPKSMVEIEAGPYLAGENKVSRTLKAFAIDKMPVTELMYKNFLKEFGRAARAGGPGSRPAKFDDHPVVNATWKEAEEFADSLGCRLPTVHEWEKAARGTDGRKFPYGGVYLPGTGKLRATTPGAGQSKETPRTTASVGSFPLGASPYGVLDMAGNVLEWTSTGRRQGKRMFRALKGSCFLDGSVELTRCAGMQFRSPEASENFIGFRCVKDID